MVSKASDDLPEPLRPVITVKVLRGISTLMFFRLCWRAPRTLMLVRPMDDSVFGVCRSRPNSELMYPGGAPLQRCTAHERKNFHAVILSGGGPLLAAGVEGPLSDPDRKS